MYGEFDLLLKLGSLTFCLCKRFSAELCASNFIWTDNLWRWKKLGFIIYAAYSMTWYSAIQLLLICFVATKVSVKRMSSRYLIGGSARLPCFWFAFSVIWIILWFDYFDEWNVSYNSRSSVGLILWICVWDNCQSYKIGVKQFHLIVQKPKILILHNYLRCIVHIFNLKCLTLSLLQTFTFIENFKDALAIERLKWSPNYTFLRNVKMQIRQWSH